MKQVSDKPPDARTRPSRLARFAVIFFHSGFILAFFLGYLARYIDPVFLWWPQLFGTVLPLLSILLVPGFLMALIKRNRPLLAIYAISFLCVTLRFWQGSSSEAEGEMLTTDNALTVLTYNAQQFVGLDKKGKSDKLTQLLESNAYTLVSFQEMGFRWMEEEVNVYDNMMTDVGHIVGMRAYLDEAGFDVTNRQQIMGSAEFVDLQRIDISSEEHRREQHVMRFHFSWQGQEAILYNVHLQTFGYQKPWDDPAFNLFNLAFLKRYFSQFKNAYLLRARESRRIKMLIEGESLPVIVAGDFNSTVHNWSYHTIAAGMKDAYRVAGDRWGATFPRSFPIFRIDHVLVSPELRVNRVRILDHESSDHLPLEAQLFWP